MAGVHERLERIKKARPVPVHHAIANNTAPSSSLDAELMHLNGWARRAQEIEAELEHAIARAIFHGASWAHVAEQLGVTKQAAQQKWGRRISEEPATVALSVTYLLARQKAVDSDKVS